MAMMLARVLPAALAFTLGCSVAHADIYTWTDKSGTINVSNLPPPEGVRVTNVMHESPKKVASSDSGGDPPSPDVQALADRVRQLEQEVDLARRQPPPPPPYPVAPYPAVQAPPPVVQYPSVQYQIVEMPPVQQYGGYGPSGGNYAWNAGCDPNWWGSCGGWWGPGFYPSTVVVVNAPGFRRPFPPHAGQSPPGGRFPMQRTGQAPNTRMHRG